MLKAEGKSGRRITAGEDKPYCRQAARAERRTPRDPPTAGLNTILIFVPIDGVAGSVSVALLSMNGSSLSTAHAST
ncbi:hypothetical protein [Bradyrhizobium icense]|uniref:hypothetical protein n=1 Tax=Bradyrhizobium icense TaxID=1274631 RepID=UPI0012E9D654|nr:hypothetical protein [Bradyrhizobium icense]